VCGMTLKRMAHCSVCFCVSALTLTHTLTCVHTCAHMRTYTHIYVNSHAHTYIQTHTHTHTWAHPGCFHTQGGVVWHRAGHRHVCGRRLSSPTRTRPHALQPACSGSRAGRGLWAGHHLYGVGRLRVCVYECVYKCTFVWLCVQKQMLCMGVDVWG
jgi:hypothetical protein